MRLQCPQCQTVLELAQAPLPGVKVQCGTCGAQFGVRSPAKAAIPSAAPTVVPVTVTEVPDTIDEPVIGPVKKKKKKKFKKKSGGALSSPVGTFVLAAVILGVVVTAGVIVAVQSGLFSGRS